MKNIHLFVAVLLLDCIACGGNDARDTAMTGHAGDLTIERNVHIYIDSLLNARDTSYLKPLITEQFRRHMNGIEISVSRREVASYLQVFFTAFPDLKITLEDSFIQEGKALILWNTSGTNTGVYGEMAATGKKVRIHGMSHMYFNEEGKIYREYVYFNELDLLQQLGYTLLPPVLE